MSYDEPPPPPPPQQPQQPQAYQPASYAPQPKSGTSGWMIAFTVVLVLALGGLVAAIISKGDSGKETANPSVPAKTTTVQHTTTVTTQAPPANVTVAPNVTLNSSGTPGTDTGGAQTATNEKTTSTP